MSIESDVQKLDPGAMVELFVLDVTALGGAVNRFHAGTNGIGGAVVWQGETYQPWPIQVKGFEFTTQGQLPRPTLSAANVNGILGAMARDYRDLLGAELRRKRTFVRYLDAVNFPGGVNASADPNAGFPDDVFEVDRKATENKNVIEFECAAKMDLQGLRVPRRVVTQTCAWKYRGVECGYTGGAVAKADDTATSDPALDQCSQKLSGCKLRFSGELPFGGFPGAEYLR